MIEIKEEYQPRSGKTWSESTPGTGHTISWKEWGDPDNQKVLFCSHGLSRNARDFDYLAKAVQHDYRVICPDYPGRGQSDWLTNKSNYNNAQYLKDSLAVLNAIEYEHLDWVGTSMGGLIGMAMAALPDNPITKMVINDVGPLIPGAALKVIGEYLGEHPRFNNRNDAIEYFKTVYASFGTLQQEHYEHFVNHGVCEGKNDDELVLNYDPAIIDEFVSAKFGDIDLWDVWDCISIPLLILRGAKSGLLLPQTVEQMKHRHGNAISVEFDDCAHAPSLMVPEQIDVIINWLQS